MNFQDIIEHGLPNNTKFSVKGGLLAIWNVSWIMSIYSHIVINQLNITSTDDTDNTVDRILLKLKYICKYSFCGAILLFGSLFLFSIIFLTTLSGIFILLDNLYQWFCYTFEVAYSDIFPNLCYYTLWLVLYILIFATFGTTAILLLISIISFCLLSILYVLNWIAKILENKSNLFHITIFYAKGSIMLLTFLIFMIIYLPLRLVYNITITIYWLIYCSIIVNIINKPPVIV